MNDRSYSELIKIASFRERYHYLRLNGSVGKETFGFDRYLNQGFYKSKEWKSIRDYVIVRDGGCDLGVDGCEIHGKVYIHHMNPLSKQDIKEQTAYLTDPEFLICTSFLTHQAIHYGDESLLIQEPIIRTLYDTCPWKKAENDRGKRYGEYTDISQENARN